MIPREHRPPPTSRPAALRLLAGLGLLVGLLVLLAPPASAGAPAACKTTTTAEQGACTGNDMPGTSRHEDVTPRLHELGGVVAGTVTRPVLPLVLLAVAGAFLLVQSRLDRHDPGIPAGKAEPEPELRFTAFRRPSGGPLS